MTCASYHYPLFVHNMRDKMHTTIGQQQKALFCSTLYYIKICERECLSKKTNAI